jgi:hypothetical protein
MDVARWDDAALRAELRRFELALRASTLVPITIESYLSYADRFLRWRAGDYAPRGVPLRGRPTPIGSRDVAGLWDDLGHYGDVLRAGGLRPGAVHTYVEHASRYLRWLAGEYRPPTAGGPPRPPVATAAPGADDGGGRPWYHESRVQAAMVAHLRRQGWEILSTADAERRERGIDILAQKGAAKLAIEVKGYPAPTRETGPRRGGPKVASPSGQAMHYLGDALFTVTRWPDAFPECQTAIALPDMPRYRDLIAQRGTALRRLGVGLFLIAEAGSVAELIAPAR